MIARHERATAREARSSDPQCRRSDFRHSTFHSRNVGKKGCQGDDPAVVAHPADYLTDEIWGELARSLGESGQGAAKNEPIAYPTWGSEIDPAAHAQMRVACSLPMASAAALMPDAHVGYGLPIGGVLATEGVVIPYAVGVDIACRMKLSVLDLPFESMGKNPRDLKMRFSAGLVLELDPRMRNPRTIR